MEKFRRRFEIPDDYLLTHPDETEITTSPPTHLGPNTIGIPSRSFTCGLRLPVQPFIIEFLQYVNLPLSIVSPSSFIQLLALEKFCIEEGNQPTLEMLFRICCLDRLENGTYYLHSQGGCKYVTVPDSNSYWSKSFYWVTPPPDTDWGFPLAYPKDRPMNLRFEIPLDIGSGQELALCIQQRQYKWKDVVPSEHPTGGIRIRNQPSHYQRPPGAPHRSNPRVRVRVRVREPDEREELRRHLSERGEQIAHLTSRSAELQSQLIRLESRIYSSGGLPVDGDAMTVWRECYLRAENTIRQMEVEIVGMRSDLHGQRLNRNAFLERIHSLEEEVERIRLQVSRVQRAYEWVTGDRFVFECPSTGDSSPST